MEEFKMLMWDENNSSIPSKLVTIEDYPNQYVFYKDVAIWAKVWEKNNELNPNVISREYKKAVKFIDLVKSDLYQALHGDLK
jgi:hypothetical protein